METGPRIAHDDVGNVVSGQDEGSIWKLPGSESGMSGSTGPRPSDVVKRPRSPRPSGAVVEQSDQGARGLAAQLYGLAASAETISKKRSLGRTWSTQMSLTKIMLWPGTKICERLGVEPESDAGLIRSMFNMIVYLVLILGVMWAVMA